MHNYIFNLHTYHYAYGTEKYVVWNTSKLRVANNLLNSFDSLFFCSPAAFPRLFDRIGALPLQTVFDIHCTFVSI